MYLFDTASLGPRRSFAIPSIANDVGGVLKLHVHAGASKDFEAPHGVSEDT